MDQHYKNPALEIIEKQEKIRKLATPPTIDIPYSPAQFSVAVDVNRILEIEDRARKMSMPKAAIDAMNAYTKTISTDGIRVLLESIQRPLADVSVRLSMLERLDFSDFYSPALHSINAMTASMTDTMRLLAETLSVYNTTAFTDSFYSSAMAIDSALVNSFEHLHDIARYFPDVAELALSENSFDMFSEELIFEEDKIPFTERIKKFLSGMTPYEKLKITVSLIGILLSIICTTNPSISIDYSNHTEQVIDGDTIKKTSDTEFNFDLSFKDQETPQNEQLVSCIEDLYQKLDALIELVSESEKQESSDCYQCEYCNDL